MEPQRGQVTYPRPQSKFSGRNRSQTQGIWRRHFAVICIRAMGGLGSWLKPEIHIVHTGS